MSCCAWLGAWVLGSWVCSSCMRSYGCSCLHTWPIAQTYLAHIRRFCYTVTHRGSCITLTGDKDVPVVSFGQNLRADTEPMYFLDLFTSHHKSRQPHTRPSDVATTEAPAAGARDVSQTQRQGNPSNGLPVYAQLYVPRRVTQTAQLPPAPPSQPEAFAADAATGPTGLADVGPEAAPRPTTAAADGSHQAPEPPSLTTSSDVDAAAARMGCETRACAGAIHAFKRAMKEQSSLHHNSSNPPSASSSGAPHALGSTADTPSSTSPLQHESTTASTTTTIAPTNDSSSNAGPSMPCPPDTAELGKATWTFLHSVAAYYPKRPTPRQQDLMRGMMEGLAEFYPCEVCREHLRCVHQHNACS